MSHSQNLDSKILGDDDIDILVYLRQIWAHKLLITVFIVLGCAVGFVYSAISPKLYKSKVTFFLPADSAGTSSLSSSAMSGYGFLLSGAGAGGGFEGQMNAIFESRRLQTWVANDLSSYLVEHHFIAAEKDPQNAVLHEQYLDRILGILSLKRAKIEKLEGIYLLSYSSTYPELVPVVLKSILEGMAGVGYELEITSNRTLIKVLDEASLPRKPYSPNYAFNIQIFAFAGFILGCLFVFLLDAVRNRQ